MLVESRFLGNFRSTNIRKKVYRKTTMISLIRWFSFKGELQHPLQKLGEQSSWPHSAVQIGVTKWKLLLRSCWRFLKEHSERFYIRWENLERIKWMEVISEWHHCFDSVALSSYHWSGAKFCIAKHSVFCLRKFEKRLTILIQSQ